MSIPTIEDEAEAIRRIARTPDGELLRRRCQRVLNSLAPASADSGALPKHEGRRSFAAELKGLMDEAISEAGLPSDRRGEPHDPDRPATFRPAEPVTVTSGGGVARRVKPYASDTGSDNAT